MCCIAGNSWKLTICLDKGKTEGWSLNKDSYPLQNLILVFACRTITFIPPTLQPGQSKSQYLSQKAQTLVRLLRQRKLSTVLQYAAALIMQLNDESAKSPGAEVDLRSSTRTLTASVLNSSLQIQSIIDVKKAALIFKLLTVRNRTLLDDNVYTPHY